MSHSSMEPRTEQDCGNVTATAECIQFGFHDALDDEIILLEAPMEKTAENLQRCRRVIEAYNRKRRDHNYVLAVFDVHVTVKPHRPVLAIAVENEAGEAIRSIVVPDPRVEFCKQFNELHAEDGFVARPTY